MGHTQPRKAIHPGEDLSFPVYTLKGHILDPCTGHLCAPTPSKRQLGNFRASFCRGRITNWWKETALANRIKIGTSNLSSKVPALCCRAMLSENTGLLQLCSSREEQINFKPYHLLLQQLVPRFTNRTVHCAFASSGQIKGE